MLLAPVNVPLLELENVVV